MECNGFNSPRSDTFPAGLRVLVVDDDPTWLKILEKMLKKCSYEVTTCGLAREALDLLRERKDGFDIVISDVNMPDMDGFKLLENMGLEMDLPVIMMSVDGETSRVMKGVQHGACDYLLKPIRMKELRNIWQHVFRKRVHEVRDIESHDGFEEIQIMRNVSDQYDDIYLHNGGDLTSGKKRKDVENKLDNKDFEVGPKKILDLMNVPWLTRENVASHLQKYRLYLCRLQKENDIKASFGGIKQADLSPKHTAGKFGLHNSINIQQDDAANGHFGTSDNKIPPHNIDHKIHEAELKGIVSMSMTKPKKAQIVNIPEPQKLSSSGTGLSHSWGSLEPDPKYAAFDSTLTMQYSWRDIQYQEYKPHLQLENSFRHLPLPAIQNHIQVNTLRPVPSTNTIPFNKERDKPSPVEIQPSGAKCRSQQIRQVAPTGNAFDLLSAQSESCMTNFHTSSPPASATFSMKNQGIDRISVTDLESNKGNLIQEIGAAFACIDEDLTASCFQGDCCSINLGFQNIAEVSPYLYDALKFDYENPCDSLEYPVIIDQGLFIA
ncbi:unnamed protein product [Ilex paraguariensis]|uniref:Two-component response regulator n=1 Tax=Ilex paraguariensis TaxID=185542 RepID=A0ABC8SF84_9AQUA